MTEDEYEVVGVYVEEMLAHPWFNRAWQEFETSACHDLLSTKTGDVSERENIWSTFEGAKTFLTFLAGIVKAKNAILKQRSIQALEDQDQEPSDDELQDWFGNGVSDEMIENGFAD